jgi:hypothetical protein
MDHPIRCEPDIAFLLLRDEVFRTLSVAKLKSSINQKKNVNLLQMAAAIGIQPPRSTRIIHC